MRDDLLNCFSAQQTMTNRNMKQQTLRNISSLSEDKQDDEPDAQEKHSTSSENELEEIEQDQIDDSVFDQRPPLERSTTIPVAWEEDYALNNEQGKYIKFHIQYLAY